MTYTVSHRQGGVQRSAVAGLIRHEFRDIDKSNGVETQHSNERIVPERTHLNESWMWVDGQQVALTDSRQITDELDSRLENAGGTRTNKKTGEVRRIALQKNAKVVRDMVLQLDPKFTRSSEWLTEEDEEVRQAETRRLLEEMIDHYGEVYGRHNLLAASLHLDETSPHVHLMVTPIDEEGRVRQESFIPAGRGSRSGLSKNDRAMRDRLKTAGYDVDPEPRGGNRSNMSIDAYAQWQESIERVEAREVEVEDREATVNRRSRVQKRNREWLEKQKAAHDAREASVSSREAEVGAREAEVVKTSQKAVQELSAAEAAKVEYLEGVERTQAVRSAFQDLNAELLRGTRVVSRDVYRDRVQPAQKRAETSVREHAQWLMSKPGDAVDPEHGPELGG